MAQSLREYRVWRLGPAQRRRRVSCGPCAGRGYTLAKFRMWQDKISMDSRLSYARMVPLGGHRDIGCGIHNPAFACVAHHGCTPATSFPESVVDRRTAAARLGALWGRSSCGVTWPAETAPYVTLGRMEDKGFITSREEAPPADEGRRLIEPAVCGPAGRGRGRTAKRLEAAHAAIADGRLSVRGEGARDRRVW